MSRPFNLLDFGDFYFRILLDLLKYDKATELVEYSISVPLKSCTLFALRRIKLQMNVPKVLRLEIINLQVTFDNETKRRELTRSITYHTLLVDSVSK